MMKRSCSALVATLGHPRMVLAAGSALLIVTAFSTVLYPPAYVPFPAVSAILAGVGAVAGIIALINPRMMTLAFAAALLAASCAARGFGLAVSVFSPPSATVGWGYMIGALLYLFILATLPGLYAKHVIPWAVYRRYGPPFVLCPVYPGCHVREREDDRK